MARRRGRGWAVGLVVLLVVAALAVVGLSVGDGYAEERVEREASRQLQSELGLPTAPRVDVEGSPFLPQVAAQRLRSVHVVADDLPRSSRSTVPIAHVDLVLTDVTTDDWFRTLTAARAEGTARVDYPALAEVAGLPLTYAGGGRLQTRASSSVFGLNVAATVTGTPRLDVAEQTIVLADPDVRVIGVDLPKPAARALVAGVTRPIPVTGLPFGLRLTSITPEDDGLHVSLQGDDVPVSR